ncbi:DUF433 domain-containing protein [Microseira sp. BLCC-F43]|uniref:DUF433 domain-containing protein n=1 Tax=Microseira sp. BLCC-F43 TaxID=3153602 RepID=UPI0035B9AE71
MTPVFNGQPAIIRTERGLAIAGTRITLYQLMDYIHAGYPPHLIRHQFYISDEQFEAAMSYIEANRAEVEAEYQTVLKEAEEIRQYWEERNRNLLDIIAKMPPPPGKEAAWEKLQTEKARLTQSPNQFQIQNKPR